MNFRALEGRPACGNALKTVAYYLVDNQPPREFIDSVSELKTRIFDYDRHLSEAAYLEATFNSARPTDLYTCIIELLRGSREDVWKAELFLIDLVTHQTSAREEFRDGVERSGIVDAIEKNLNRNDYHIRKNSIYALGKIGAVASVPKMLHAFDHYLASDPLNLGNVIGELRWLTSDDHFPLIEKMINSPHYTVRWAALPILENECMPIRDARFAQALAWLDRLSEDPHSLVAAEARYDAALLRCYDETKRVQKTEEHRERRLIKSVPPIKFAFQVELGFLHQMTGSDYTLSELEDFIIKLV